MRDMDSTGTHDEAEGRTRYASAACSLLCLLHGALLMLAFPSRTKWLKHPRLRRAKYTRPCVPVVQGFLTFTLVEAASELPCHPQASTWLP